MTWESPFYVCYRPELARQHDVLPTLILKPLAACYAFSMKGRSPLDPLESRAEASAPPPVYDRSAVMRAVKSRDTAPERAVRAILWPIARGYRLNRNDLPGKPDVVYIARKLAIFIHGCFWHGHDCPRGARMPKANADYWRAKIARNRARDARTLAAYPAMGWR